MRSIILTLLACASLALGQVTGKLGNAAITENNPSGVAYMASLPNGNGIQGQIEGVSNSNGTGVNFNVNFFNFPDASEGPFLYHIHVDSVPSNGDCYATLEHLDPYERGTATPCDVSQPETCQVGDLSGKHDAMSPPANSGFQAYYLELYVSTEPGLGSFFGNRSIVIHSHNLTRLACANFELAPGSPKPSPVAGGSTSSTSAAASTSATPATSSDSAVQSSATGSSTSTASSTASSTAASASASNTGGGVAKIVNSAAMLAGLVFVMAFAF